MARERYQRAKLDKIINAALRRAKRPPAEWPAARDRIASEVEEILTVSPFPKSRPLPSRPLEQAVQSARRFRRALAKLDARTRHAIDTAHTPARGGLDLEPRKSRAVVDGVLVAVHQFELSAALVVAQWATPRRGRPPARWAAMIAEFLASCWLAEGLSFALGAKTAPREWPQFVEYVFCCAGLPQAPKHAGDVVPGK